MSAAQKSGLHRAWNLLRDLSYHASLYLPLLVMGVLALATYWLVNNAPAPLTAEAAQAPKHEADYFMRDFAMRRYDAAGALQSELAGEQLRHFADTDTFEVNQLRLQTQRNGRLTVAKALRGVSNADGSEVQLLGDAVVVREAFQGASGQTEPRLEFRGEFLHAFTQAQRLRSHKPVDLVRGGARFSADSLDYDRNTSVVELKGRVRGAFTVK